MAAADGIFTNICWTSCRICIRWWPLWTPTPSAGEMIQAETGLKALTDYKELFAFKESIDLVVNASFTQDHAAISKDLLEHGFRVLSEKPAAPTVAEFDAVTAAAKQAGTEYLVFQTVPVLALLSEDKGVHRFGYFGGHHANRPAV